MPRDIVVCEGWMEEPKTARDKALKPPTSSSLKCGCDAANEAAGCMCATQDIHGLALMRSVSRFGRDGMKKSSSANIAYSKGAHHLRMSRAVHMVG